MILVSFLAVGCVDEVVVNQINYYEYKYVYFLRYYTLTVIDFMNGERVC